MRLIKAVLTGAASLFIIITLFSLLIPSGVKVVRTIVIGNSEKNKIYAQVYDLQNWKNWHPSFSSNLTTVNFGKVTAGENASCDIIYHNKAAHLQFIKADTGTISFTLTARGENKSISSIRFYSLSSRQTQVNWEAVTYLRWYPWDKFYGIFIDKLTGPGYEAALEGLKSFSEKK